MKGGGDLEGDDLRGEREVCRMGERARWSVGEVLPGAVTSGVLSAEGECIYRNRGALTSVRDGKQGKERLVA